MSRLPMEEAQRLARGNYRATVRYRCAPATAGRVYLPDDHEYQRAWVLNISKTGVGLTLARPLAEGAYFVLRMRGAGDGAVHELPAHVVHATQTTQGDWLIGCELVRSLDDHELDALL